jgi:PAS domain S-box-containing protein
MKTITAQEQPGAESVHRLIVETMTEAAFIVSFEGVINFCNARFGQFVKCPLERIVGRPLEEFAAPNSRAAAAALLIAAQEQRSVRQGLVFQGADGACVPTHLSANVIDQPNGLSICIVASDLTEMENSTELIQQLRRQQEALRRSEEHARLALRAGQMGTWDRVLPDGSLIWNEELFRLLGYEPGAVTPSYQLWSQRIHHDDREEAAARFHRTSSVGGEFTSEYRVLWPDDTVRWVQEHGQTECDAAGHPVRSYGVVQDVTERKEAEEALRKANDRLAWLARLPEESPNPVVRVSAEGTVMYRNQAAAETPEWACEVHKTLPAPLLALVGQAMASGQMSQQDVPMGEKVFTVWVTPIVADCYANVYGQNITPRMQAEEELHQTTEDLKRSNRDLEQFAYVAGHDLQEPLRMVTGLLGLLRDGYKGKQLDAKADQYIDVAVDGAARMSTMIKDLLEYSRTGNQGLKPVPTDIAGIVEVVKANLRRAMEESKVVLTNDPLPTVTADSSQMMQVFQNIIGNAIKFRLPDRPCQVHVGARRREGQWLFWVRDNGIGIDPKQADRVFTIFQRLHTRERYPGSGIGLAICKKIVERHGGQIWVESTPGAGSVFCFTLPDSDEPSTRQ